MILADKIIRLRKKNGWSQEELAEKMKVSRQAVSKWEGALTVPDLERILQLGELFGVTTDYLLKDSIEEEEFTDENTDSSVKRITLSEANEFIEWRKAASIRIAAATFLCILSVIPLLILGAATELSSFGMSENLAVGIGLITMFIIVSIAVAIYIFCGFRNKPYEFIDMQPFETAYGVVGMVKEQQKKYQTTYIKINILATCLCILSPIPLLVGAFLENEFLIVVLLAATMLVAAIGVMIYIIAGVKWASMQKLLKAEEYAAGYKPKKTKKDVIGTIYWLIAAAIYIGWSLLTNNWQITWVVWPIAGVLFAAVMAACNLFIDKNE